VALDVDATAPGTPGELGVLGRRDVDVRLAVVLDQLLEHHRAGRHVDAQGEGLGGEDRLDEQVQQPLPHHHVLKEGYGPLLLHDRGRVAAHRVEPVAELLGVGHRRRQRDDLHVIRAGG
jgi:hypothetical protein